MSADFFKDTRDRRNHRPERLHDFDIPKSLGGGVMVIRELYASDYNEVVKQASKGIPDGSDGGRKASMVEMFATVGTNRKALMRVACVKSIAGVEAWSHEDGADGFIEGQSPKMVALIDKAIEFLHELDDEEEAAFISSHRQSGGRSATKSQPASESAA